MNFLKRDIRILLLAALTMLTISSCKKFQGDVTIPAYIHLDRVDIVPQSHNAPSLQTGFYSSDIDAVYVVAYAEGSMKEDTLGTFQLPFTVPVLHYGDYKYIRLYPVIKIDGVSGLRTYYTALLPIELNNVHLAADSVTNLGRYDADLQQYYVEGNYKTRDVMQVLMEDYFEPTDFSTNFDSNLVWVADDPAGACTGKGYGRIHLADTDATATVTINREFSPSSANALYLELDYKSDVSFYIHMLGYQTNASGNTTSNSVMCLYPSAKWQKMYIMLGRTWSQFYYNVPIALYLQAVNVDGRGGDVLLDNVKLISFPAI